MRNIYESMRSHVCSQEMLEELYHAISREEIKLEQREFIRSVNCEGWLTKRGGRVQTWKKRWAILSLRRPPALSQIERYPP